MFRINLSKREKGILVAMISIVAMVVLYNFIFEPAFNKWKRLDNEIAAKKIILKKNIKLLENRGIITKDYDIYVTRVKDTSEVLGYIEKKAKSIGIRTSNIRPRPAVQRDLYKEYVVELHIEGTLDEINDFVSDIVKPPAFITVTKFDLRQIRETSYLKGTLILSKLLL